MTVTLNDAAFRGRGARVWSIGVGLWVAATVAFLWAAAEHAPWPGWADVAYGGLTIVIATATVYQVTAWAPPADEWSRFDRVLHLAGVAAAAAWLAGGLYEATAPLTRDHSTAELTALALGAVAGATLMVRRDRPSIDATTTIPPAPDDAPDEVQGEPVPELSNVVAIWSRPEFRGLSAAERGELERAGEVMQKFIAHKVFLSDGLAALKTATSAIRNAHARGVTASQLADALNLSERWVRGVIERESTPPQPQ